MKFYQHTINGKPAEFEGRQIVYSSSGQGTRYNICKNLAEIKKQQKESTKYRKYHNFDIPKYGYVIIEVPVASNRISTQGEK